MPCGVGVAGVAEPHRGHRERERADAPFGLRRERDFERAAALVQGDGAAAHGELPPPERPAQEAQEIAMGDRHLLLEDDRLRRHGAGAGAG